MYYIAMNNQLDHPNIVKLHAAISDKNLVVLIFEDADHALLDQLVAPKLSDGDDVHGPAREAQVRIFTKQLLTALQYMHERSIAHLDLRPECVLLQDDHLRLADFGQSRYLLKGKASGRIIATPEFVSPEIIQGQSVSLASDMWSVGSLVFVLLSGVSPFLGDNDRETISNIVHGHYSLSVEQFSEVSAEAMDFLQKLLLLDPRKRMTVDQALNHDWLVDPALEDAKLQTDCLREFKYKHKWLERRVFVQQTPSEQSTQLVEAPSQKVAQSEQNSASGPVLRAEPYVIYDYNQLKKSGSDKFIPEVVNGATTQPKPLPKHIQEQILQQLQQPPPFYDPRKMHPSVPEIPPHLKPEEVLTSLGIDPRRLQGFQGALPPFNTLAKHKPRPDDQRKRLEPQAKGETPSHNKQSQKRMEPKEEEDQQIPPIQLIRGENRQIQYELATRNLSDISEEGSVAGSVASLDDVQDLPKKDNHDRSRSSTPQAESDSTTPLASPTFTVDSVDPVQQYFGNKEIPRFPELLDPNVPVGAPLFIEGLSKGQPITVELPVRSNSRGAGSLSPAALSPNSKKPTGTKSPIMTSPGREHQMECVIATKYGKQRRTFGMAEETGSLDDLENESKNKAVKAQISTHDDDYNAKIKSTLLDDLEKYRPKNFYKDDDIEFERKEIDVDDYPWESNYQIGPETLLLATRGASFNARVRDYRRELWGDGAPLVRQGILGYRNQDITVRERRRFTDLIREDPQIAKSVEKVERDLSQTYIGSLRRNRPELVPVEDELVVKPDGRHPPIFQKRLQDVYMREEAGEVVFSCLVIGNPQPQITFFYQGSALVDDDKRKIIHEGPFARLILRNPMFVDSGEYSCTATNELGSDQTSCRLLSGNAPGKPSRPEISLASDTEIFISWEPPESRTYLYGFSYRLECRPAGDNDHMAVWTTISDKVDAECVVLKHLTPAGIYQFRVTATNGFGWGEPSLTSRIIRTHNRGVPKLNIDILKTEHRLHVVQMPQHIGKTKSGLTEISEELEDEEEMEDDVASSVSSTINDTITLSTDDLSSRYQLTKLIFQGKFSLIREAIDKSNSKPCIVKVRSFEKTEFDTLVASQHENVVKLISGYQKSNCLLLFTERLYENVFDRFVCTDPYNEEHVCMTVRQICSALHWIHFKNVLHLDIQPNNVMFADRRSWLIKIIDFDKAAFIGQTKPINGAILNPEWAPPELIKGEQPNTETDIWGMGIITFCLLAGFHPFSGNGDTVEEVRKAVLTEKCNPNLIPVQASQEALRFATWAIKKDPRKRMRTSEALNHRFLSNEASMSRRRENIKYSNNRLQQTARRTLFRRATELWDINVGRFNEVKQGLPPPGFLNGAPLNIPPFKGAPREV